MVRQWEWRPAAVSGGACGIAQDVDVRLAFPISWVLRSIVALGERLYEESDVVSTSPKRLKASSPERGSHSR
jgi:hypothetical protein